MTHSIADFRCVVRIPLLYFDDFLTSFCHCIDACTETFWHTIRVHGELAPRANRKEQSMKCIGNLLSLIAMLLISLYVSLDITASE